MGHATGLVGLEGWPYTSCWMSGADADEDTKPTSYWFACFSVSAALSSFTGIVSGVIAVAYTQKDIAVSSSSLAASP